MTSHSSNMKKSHWLDPVETVSVVLAAGGSVAAAITQQVALASLPLSLSVVLGLLNRRRLLDEMAQGQQAAIVQVQQDQANAQMKLEHQLQQQATGLSDRLSKTEQDLSQHKITAQSEAEILLQQITDLTACQDTTDETIAQQQASTQTELAALIQQLAKLQQQADDLGQATAGLQAFTQNLRNEEEKIAEKVEQLQELETRTQSIHINPTDASAYYNRGLIYQRSGDRQSALRDFSEAIRLHPGYAQAFQARGLLHGDLGDKRKAVQDLRDAANYFFEAGDVTNYELARNLSRQIHELSSETSESPTSPPTEAAESIALSSLFS